MPGRTLAPQFQLELQGRLEWTLRKGAQPQAEGGTAQQLLAPLIEAVGAAEGFADQLAREQAAQQRRQRIPLQLQQPVSRQRGLERHIGQGRSGGQGQKHPVHRGRLTLPAQAERIELQPQASLLELLQQGCQGSDHHRQGAWIPENRLVAAQQLGAAALEPAAAALLGQKAILQQPQGEGVGGQHHHIVKTKGVQGKAGRRTAEYTGGGQGQVGGDVGMHPPELPPGAVLRPPERVGQPCAQAFLPKGGNRAIGGGGETLHQGSGTEQFLQALGLGPRQAQQAHQGEAEQQKNRGRREGQRRPGHPQAGQGNPQAGQGDPTHAAFLSG